MIFEFGSSPYFQVPPPVCQEPKQAIAIQIIRHCDEIEGILPGASNCGSLVKNWWSNHTTPYLELDRFRENTFGEIPRNNTKNMIEI